MVSRFFAPTLVAFGSMIVLASLALAEEAAPEPASGAPRAVPTLSDRLEQFRRDLLGNPEQAEPSAESAPAATVPQDSRSASTKLGARRPPQAATTNSQKTQPKSPPRAQVAASKASLPRPVQTAARPQIQQQVASPTGSAPAVRTPSRMEVQSARRAQPRGGLIPTKTPPEIGAPQKQIVETPEPREALEADVQPEAELAEDAPTPARSRVDIDELADGTRAPRVARALPRPVDERHAPTPAHEPVTEDETAEPGVLFSADSPVISVEASGPRTIRVGDQARFAVKIRNAGASANNVVVTIDVPEHAEIASAHATAGTVPTRAADQKNAPVEWRINRLEGKSGEMLELVLVPHSSDSLDLPVRFTYTPEASRMVVEVQEAKLEMNITGPEDVLYGSTKMYKLSLSNPGNGDAENVVIGLLPVGRGADAIASHKLGTLHAGESKTIDVELTARQAGTIAIKAQAFADGGLRTEATEQVLVRRASLQVEVEAPRITFAGTVGTYRVKVLNQGDAPADDVQVSAMLPPDAKFIGSSAGGRFDAQQGKVNWSAGNLQPGTERTLDMQCTLGTPGDNRLQIVATAADDLSASASSNTKVEALADLKIELRDPQGPIAIGDDAAYEIVIRNRGSAPAENVDLAVFFSEGLEATTVEGPAHEITTGQVVFSPIAAVGAGETVVIRIHAKADRAGHHVFRAELVCQSLGTKLAAEEATYFYGDEAGAAADTASPDRAEPQPTEAEPRELPSGDEPPPVPD